MKAVDRTPYMDLTVKGPLFEEDRHLKSKPEHLEE